MLLLLLLLFTVVVAVGVAVVVPVLVFVAVAVAVVVPFLVSTLEGVITGCQPSETFSALRGGRPDHMTTYEQGDKHDKISSSSSSRS